MKEGSVVGFVLPSYMPTRAVEFYSKLFGWKSGKLEGAPIEFHTLQTPNKEVEGGVVPVLAPGQTQFIIISVDSLEKKAEDAVKLGAQVALGRQELKGKGSLLILMDPDGNLFGLLESQGK
ncbi:hypothetical protein HZC08_00525 [Candidatus Micrarchaeota archaeon]|nr:hypothetical protein [Candidatus Micrarchaeota archaeon]